MSVPKPGLLTVRSASTGALVLTGELDVATIQRLQDKIDEIVVPGQPIVLDLADLTFLDTSAMHCFVTTFEATGHPVVLLNASRSLRRILGHMTRPRGMGLRRRGSVLGKDPCVRLPSVSDEQRPKCPVLLRHDQPDGDLDEVAAHDEGFELLQHSDIPSV